jgi:hypothetical protein
MLAVASPEQELGENCTMRSVNIRDPKMECLHMGLPKTKVGFSQETAQEILIKFL